jgi:hypothetical protein
MRLFVTPSNRTRPSGDSPVAPRRPTPPAADRNVPVRTAIKAGAGGHKVGLALELEQ